LAAGKKNAGPYGTVIFMDESGFSEGSVIRRTWAPRGQTPVLRARRCSWKWMSAMGALAYSRDGRKARVFLHFQPGAVRAPHVLRFLRHLRRHVRGRVVLLWDGVRPHRAAAVRDWIARNKRWLTVERLPAYAPDLNPVEGMWAWTKGTGLANVCEDTLAPVVSRARSAVKRLRHKDAVIHGFLAKAGLSL
jgi:transposase